MITGAQIVAARELLQWAQTDLARKAKLRPSVIMWAEPVTALYLRVETTRPAGP
jgi:ribosome-binding protein aMBF1 (putative translation factor)